MLATACGSASSPTTTPTTVGGGGTTTTAPPTTAPPTTAPTTTSAPVELPTATAYFFADSGGNGSRSGPFLIAVAVPTDSEEAPELSALLAGPPADAQEAGITSEIPAGTALESLDIGSDGVALVELTQTFDDGGGSASMMGRLAQLTFTLTARDDVDSVLLMENGAVVEVFSSEGIVLDGPMKRSDFEDFLPGILVEDPAWGATVSLPFTASGTAAVFEAVFQMQALSGDDVVFQPPFVTTDNGVGFGAFEVEVDADVPTPGELTLRVWELSARDGSVINERFVPLTVVGG